MAGAAFTLILFTAFTISERTTRKRVGAHAELDQFNLETGSDLTPETLGVRLGSVLVPVRNYNTLHNLKAVLDRVDTQTQDVVVLHLRVLQRAGEGESELAPEQLFSLEEQKLFTYALQISEAKGKTIHLAVAAIRAGAAGGRRRHHTVRTRVAPVGGGEAGTRYEALDSSARLLVADDQVVEYALLARSRRLRHPSVVSIVCAASFR